MPNTMLADGAPDRGQMSGKDSHVPAIDTRATSRLILDIIFEYALNKFDDSKDRLESGSDNFLAVIERFVGQDQQVKTCLPAFPFKSANKVYKVLSSLPDKAEELALARLHDMCTRIQEVYTPGAQVTIISDGITYNDLLCISDKDTWAYGEALRDMATHHGFHHIQFSRMRDLLDFPLPRMREITYIANCTTFRRLLLNTFGRADLNIDHEIATNPDTKLTYLGYKRFLESDLKHIFPQGPNRGANEYRRDCKYLAKQMLVRGDAFARAVKNAFPDHLRLSIHESSAGQKLSICLLNTNTGFTTPWHCSVAQLASGEWISAPMGEFSGDDRLELVYYPDGRPSHFHEKPQTDNGLGITESTASYLRPHTSRNSTDYRSGSSTPSQSSLASTPKSQSPPTSASRGPEAAGKDAIRMLDDSHGTPVDVDPSIPYGRRLIPQIMDNLAAAEPERIVFSLASPDGDSLHFDHISAKMFAQAVDKTAWWLYSRIGKPESIAPVGYIGPHDLRHILLTYACVATSWMVFFFAFT